MSICVTVIIAAYEKPWHLERVLHGYDVQTDRNFEIVVAEDGMSQKVADVVERFSRSSNVDIRHIYQQDEGFRKSVILNKALAIASGEYIIFTDDDCVPRENLVATHIKYMKQGQYIVGAYNRIPDLTTKKIEIPHVREQKIFSMLWLLINGYRPYRGFVRIIAPQWLATLLDLRGKISLGRFPGGHSSCFKQDALAIGGFNENMSYGLEDREFGTRLCNFGIYGRRIKNSTYMIHLAHERPYQSVEKMKENEKILAETVETGRVRSAHLEEKSQ